MIAGFNPNKQAISMKVQKNSLLIISQSLFSIILILFACAGLVKGSDDLEARALALVRAESLIEETPAPEAAPGAVDSDDEHESEKEDKKSGKAETGLKDGTYFGSGQGYGGPIKVKLTVADGKIAGLDIVDASSETPSFFSRAQSVAASIVNAGTADVDGVSGATLSSNGIKAAASDAIKQAGGKGSVNLKKAQKTAAPNKGKTTKKAYKKPKAGWKDGTYTGSARGFGGTVTVTVKIKGGKIKSVSASGPSETASYWSRAKAVTGKIVRSQSPRVDAVSGATYSSNGIINAAISALSKAEIKTSKKKGPKEQTISTKADEYEVTCGKTVKLGAKAKTKLTYTSSNSRVATVSKNGTVTAKAHGTAKITIKAVKSKNYKKAVKRVTIKVLRKSQTIIVQGIKSGAALEFSVEDTGAEFPLNATSESGSALTYSTSDQAVAAVSADGVILVTGAGPARITIKAAATSVYEEATRVIIVKVKEGEQPAVSGTFTGVGKGYGGDVTASVVIDNDVIKSITVDGPEETSKYWFKAKKIVPKMVSQQTWNIDAVSGATLSSNGIRNAVKQALQKAGLI